MRYKKEADRCFRKKERINEKKNRNSPFFAQSTHMCLLLIVCAMHTHILSSLEEEYIKTRFAASFLICHSLSTVDP